MTKVHIGYKYMGTTDGTTYEVICIDPREGITYGLSYKKGGNYRIMYASHNLLMWLLKSGGLVKI